MSAALLDAPTEISPRLTTSSPGEVFESVLAESNPLVLSDRCVEIIRALNNVFEASSAMDTLGR